MLRAGLGCDADVDHEGIGDLRGQRRDLETIDDIEVVRCRIFTVFRFVLGVGRIARYR